MSNRQYCVRNRVEHIVLQTDIQPRLEKLAKEKKAFKLQFYLRTDTGTVLHTVVRVQYMENLDHPQSTILPSHLFDAQIHPFRVIAVR